MKIIVGLAAAATVLLAWAPTAAAHPLGNFTINQYSRIVIGVDKVAVRYVIDMAEIPTFQERSRMDADHNEQISDSEAAAYFDAALPTLLDTMELTLDGDPSALTVVARELAFPEGAGGLNTLRLVVDLETPINSVRGSGTYRVDAYPGRLGWREVVVQGGRGMALVDSDAPAVSTTDELRSYPADSLAEPLDVTHASFAYEPGAGSTAAPDEPESQAPVSDELLASLVRGELALLPALLALGVSLVLGAAHAVSPGHGKTLVAAYLIGSGGSLRQAMWLGVTVAVTHTMGIFVLGAATLIAAEFFVPERVIGWLALIAGVTVVVLGAGLAAQQIIGGGSHAENHDHSHDDIDSHHAHGHAKGVDHAQLSTRRALGLGLVGGLVPSASALLVMLLAITLDRLLFGLVLIVAFGLGMALVLGAISASVVFLRDRAEQTSSKWRGHRWISVAQRRVPLVSALVVLCVGLVTTVRALGNLI